jgi:hypothetical protein
MQARYFRVDRRDIAYFRFILEAYEGLSVLSTVDASAGVVVVTIADDFVHDVDDLITALGREIGLTEITQPEIPSQETQSDA